MAGLTPAVAPPHGEPAALAELFAAWRTHSPLAADCIGRLRGHRHGDLPRWLRALGALPTVAPKPASFGRVVRVGSANDLCADARQRLRAALLALAPWRKGPFALFGVHVDAEWRSDRKWARVAPHVDLAGKRVLDVGCGNGYYGWRMVAAGAASVVGVDPSPRFALQHAAVCHYLDAAQRRANVVLPLGLGELPAQGPFDVIFCMGVVYHRRDPAAHLRALAAHAHPNTVLVLESLVVDGPPIRAPARYARMNNVHVVPDRALLLAWTCAAGFTRAEVVDITATTTSEQRATEWMPYQSLADALDPTDATRTVEGHPAPQRAVVIARR